MSASAAWASTASRPTRKVEKVTDETNRSLLLGHRRQPPAARRRSRHRRDGRIFFSEATIRYEMHEWPVDGLEARGNGRIICYDPNTGTTRTVLRDLTFPNGICIASDGQSILFAETWGCRVKRYWFDGPKKGKVEMVIDNLPGYPDNINRASDGNYWLALVGMRSPALDLAWKMPGFRRRMAKRVPRRRMAVPQHQHRLRRQIRREGRDPRNAVGSAAARTIR